MTPKEKAEELVNKFMEYSHTDFITYRGGYQMDSQIENAKQCALIAVDEVIKSHHNLYGVNNKEVKFYLEVKQEIELL
jgi:hypothetical protein